MIIDIHTHLVDFEREFGQQLRDDLTRCGIPHDVWRYSEESYLEGTKAADKVVVFGLKAAKTGWNVDNRRVADFVLQHAEKYIFFVSIDPSEPDCLDELKFYHLNMGCKGVKIGPIYQGVHPLDERFYGIYDYCEKNKLPIMTHMATTFSSGVPLDYARPVHMDQVACDFPGLKIVLAHLGHPWEGETLAIIRRQENVYADLSALYYRPWQFYNAMQLAVEYNCCNKILFGSDFPATTTQSSLDGLRRLNQIALKSQLPIIPESIIEAIIHRNSLEALNIDTSMQS